MELEPVIGIEIHVQLRTRTKMFCGCELSFGEPPNTRTCEVCLGLPGALPVANAEAIHYGLMIAMALECEVAPRSIFHRKNYFYPDLPKGYQISQYAQPVVSGGSIAIVVDGVEKTVRLTRAHLEEDAGKLLHEQFHGASGVDLNRAGTPLLEIVSEPDMPCTSWSNLPASSSRWARVRRMVFSPSPAAMRITPPCTIGCSYWLIW